MSADLSISFENVTFGFDEKVILNNFSFEATAGHHTVIKGESGSGKSTILKLILGFHLPTSGTIKMENSAWTPQTIRRYTAWLPQDLNLGDNTVQKILEKPFEFQLNKTGNVGREKQLKVLHTLGLASDVLDKRFRNLSTGQRQRIGLALCHLLDKPLLLLDEPTSALDERSKRKTVQLLLAHTNITVISTSHDSFWLNQADNIIEL